MHWSLTQSISQSHEGAVTKFIITVKLDFNSLAPENARQRLATSTNIA